MKFAGANVYGLRADWQWLDAQGLHMLEDGQPIDHLLELSTSRGSTRARAAGEDGSAKPSRYSPNATAGSSN